ncbi:MAG: hypothetical protein IKH36_01770 [Bacilli bacterium]|nr:hypothetical protein [Bacilli bacterium]
MTDYSNWKILVTEADEKADEYAQVAEWCNENDYHIEIYIDENEIEWYKVVKNPEPTPPTDEEIKRMRILYRREHIDDQTAERSRKMANGTWTDEDEVAYLALDAEVTAYIEEHYPYNE